MRTFVSVLATAALVLACADQPTGIPGEQPVPTFNIAGETCDAVSPGGRWCDKGDGTVLDLTTGLYWLKIATCFGHNINWHTATWMAGALADDVYGSVGCNLSDGSEIGDWRLPTADEFLDLMSGTERITMSKHYGGDPASCNPGCYGPLYFFDNVAGQFYWSSTDATYGPLGARVAYLVGAGSFHNFPKSVETYLWPVRETIVVEVTIDIKPGSDPNSINLGSNGTIPVAILTTESFDAATVNPTTVTLADAAVKVKGKGTPMAAEEDVNSDGNLDLVVHVETVGLSLTEGDTEAVLAGETFDGMPIRGTDTIRVVP